MLDPRIYRMGLIPVVLAVIVLAFSLGDQSGALSTNLPPDAFIGANAYSTMNALAKTYPDRRPGSAGDDALASYVSQQLKRDGFNTTTDVFSAKTIDGRRIVENVVAVRAGQGSGSIVVVAHRDSLSSPDTAGVSSTAVMLELARVLSGRNQQHTIILASTSGSVGTARAQRLAHQLPGPVDAVLVLGDMASSTVRQPVVVTWSDSQKLAPPMLRNTVAGALGAEAGLSAGTTSVAGQFARLAIPITSTEQAAFNAAGEPSVLVSLSSEQGPAAGALTSKPRISAVGRAMLRTLTALDTGTTIPAPSSYLLWSGKVIPAWAVHLLVLFLILPVLGATIDGVARTRRRGQSALRGAGWVLGAGFPFAVAAMIVFGTVKAGWIGPAPGAPLGAANVSLGGGGIAVLVCSVLLIVAGLVWVWPAVRPRPPKRRRARDDHPEAGTGAGLMLVLSLVTLAIWISNPFAAALLVPALHLWMWITMPNLRVPIPVAGLLLAIGLAPPILVAVYYTLVFGLGPLTSVWHWMLALGGGVVSPVWAIEWSIVAGCVVSAIAIVIRRGRGAEAEPAPVTVRGPITYAGPGSLGGTKSALRR